MNAKKVGIIGKKLGMTQVYVKEGLVGVTVVDFSNINLLGKRTVDKDGYNAAILGYDYNKFNNPKYIKEVKVDDTSIYEEEKYLSLFDNIKKVDVIGIMKGRGFTGVMKRHGFAGGPGGHGAKHWHRRPGSIGGHTYPAKVWKGQKMPGHYGNSRVCILGQKLVRIDKEKKLMFIKGSIPGAKNSYVFIRDAIKG